MQESEPHLPKAAEQIKVPNDEVLMSSLLNPPTREYPDNSMVYLIRLEGKKSPGNLAPDWEEKLYRDSEKAINYVRMNSCAIGEFEQAGYLGTGKINGCTVVAASYRDEKDTVHTFMGHYDDENIREKDVNGNLKISGLLADFAGDHQVRVALAYPKIHNEMPKGDTYDAKEYPVWAILNDCQQLAAGADVAFIPYKTTDDLSDRTIGHVFAVGRGGSSRIIFSWDGHPLEVGKPEEFNEARKQIARARIADYDEDDFLRFE